MSFSVSMLATVTNKSSVLQKWWNSFGENIALKIFISTKGGLPRFYMKTATRQCLEASLSLETTRVRNFNSPIKFLKSHFVPSLKKFLRTPLSGSTLMIFWNTASNNDIERMFWSSTGNQYFKITLGLF